MAISSIAHIDMSEVKQKPGSQRWAPSQPSRKVSVADIAIDWTPAKAEQKSNAEPASQPAASALEVPWDRTERDIELDGIRGRLRHFQAEHLAGSDKHSQVVVLIELCLEEGLSIGKDILAMVVSLGFDQKHVGIMLKRETGSTGGRSRWCKAADGTYRPMKSKIS